VQGECLFFSNKAGRAGGKEGTKTTNSVTGKKILAFVAAKVKGSWKRKGGRFREVVLQPTGCHWESLSGSSKGLGTRKGGGGEGENS